MPRDLFSSSSSDSPSPKELSLVASPESQTPTPTAIAQGFGHDGGNSDDDPQLESESPGWENEDGSSGGRNHFLIRHEDSMRGTASQLLRGRGAQQANGVDDLHPFVQTMSLVDLESCLALENACFEEHERESRKTVRSIISIYCLRSRVAVVFSPQHDPSFFCSTLLLIPKNPKSNIIV